MSNFKVKQRMRSESNVIQLDEDLVAIGGLYRKSTVVDSTSPSGTLPTEPSTYIKDINILIGDGETEVVSGTFGYAAPLSFSGTITGWKIIETSDPAISGSITIDILKSVDTAYPPDSYNSIAIADKPRLEEQYTRNSEDLSYWDTELEHNDIIGFSVEENVSCKRVHLVLSVEVES